MNMHDMVFLSALIFAAAVLYSSVGHGGASGYLAAMALVGLLPSEMKPAALLLNIFVAAIATIKFYKADCFSWSIFLPFAAASIPFAFLGGKLSLPSSAYRDIVGVVLLSSAAHLFWYTRKPAAVILKSAPKPLVFLSGAAIGLLSGLTGIGGGIFLSPLLLFMRWSDARQTAGVSAAFILVNSIAGMLGHLSGMRSLPNSWPSLVFAAVLGGILGSGLGSRRFSNMTLRRLLAAVLVVAGTKFILT